MTLGLFGEIFGNTLFFTVFIVSVFSIAGWFTGSFAVGAMGGFLSFINIASQVNNALLSNMSRILLVSLALFTAYRLYGQLFSGGETEV